MPDANARYCKGPSLAGVTWMVAGARGRRLRRPRDPPGSRRLSLAALPLNSVAVPGRRDVPEKLCVLPASGLRPMGSVLRRRL